MKKVVSLSALALMFLGACGTSAGDFKTAAEGAAVNAAEEANPNFTATASCEEPASTDVGETFTCTVTYNDGDVQPGTATIQDDNRVEVVLEATS